MAAFTSRPDGHSVAGGTLVTWKVMGFEVKLVGAGFRTVTVRGPVELISVALIEQVSLVEFANVVVWFVPFQRITEPLTKPRPLTVNVKEPELTTAESGVRLRIEGIALRLTAFDVRLVGAGVKTVIG